MNSIESIWVLPISKLLMEEKCNKKEADIKYKYILTCMQWVENIDIILSIIKKVKLKIKNL